MPEKSKSRIAVTVGDRVRRARKKLGIGQIETCERAGMSLSHYQKIERGGLDIRLSTLMRVAAALEVEASDLLRDL